MTSGIDSDLLTDLGSRPTNAIAVFELSIGGTTRKYAETWAASSTGLYEGYVIESGEITRAVSDNSFRLPRDQASVVVRDDTSKTLEKAIMADGGASVTGGTATIKIASTTRAQAKWFTVFSGIIDSFGSASPSTWRFELKRSDRRMNGLVRIPYIKEYDWPDAPEFDLPAQVVYGSHDSSRTAETGMVPAIYVDQVNFRYVVSLGFINAVNKVYVDGVREADANWSSNLSFYNGGNYWSVIDFTTDQGADAVVTVDCDGVDDSGLVTNPATQLEHFLDNFVFSNWAGSRLAGSTGWSGSTGMVDTTYFAAVETFLSDKQIARGSRVVTAGRKAIDELSDWMNQWQIKGFWTYGGKIAIRPDDHTTTAYVSSPHFRPETSPEPETRNAEFDTTNLIDSISVEYLFSESTGTFQGQLTVDNPSKSHDASESLQLKWRESVA